MVLPISAFRYDAPGRSMTPDSTFGELANRRSSQIPAMST
jgi:hypothetical protein